MKWPSQSQIYSGIRSAGIAVGGVATLAVTLGSLDLNTSQSLVTAFNNFFTDLQKLIGDSYILIALLAPIFIGVLSKLGWTAASLPKQLKSVTSQVQINGEIVVPADVAKAVDHPQVVAKP